MRIAPPHNKRPVFPALFEPNSIPLFFIIAQFLRAFNSQLLSLAVRYRSAVSIGAGSNPVSRAPVLYPLSRSVDLDGKS